MNYIYRVQDSNGNGCYRELGSRYWAEQDHDDEDHPMPSEDGIDIDDYKDLPDDHRFGFRTKDQAMRWFNERELENLAEHGYYLKRVRGKVIMDGFKQCVFVPERFL